MCSVFWLFWLSVLAKWLARKSPLRTPNHAMRFLMQMLRNVFYVRVGKRYVRLWRSRRSWTVVWGSLRWDGSWKRPAGARATPTAAAGAGAADTPPARKPNPNLKQRPPWVLFCLKLDNSCCYAPYSCGNNCNVVVKVVQECKFLKTHFTSVLRKQFAVNDTFLREANSYNWALALRNSRMVKGSSPQSPFGLKSIYDFRFSVLFHCCIVCLSGPPVLHNKFHTLMARYSL